MRTPYYPQLEERDCGATCLRMVLGHYGLDVPMDTLRVRSGTTGTGADLAGLARAAESVGFEAVAAELDYEELLAPDLWPAILHWDGDHYVVLTEATPERAVVLDPAFGERRLDRSTFEEHRVGAGRSRAGLIVLPRERSDDREPDATPPSPPPAEPSSEPPVADLAPAPTRFRFAATVFLYAGLLAVALVVLSRSLTLAVDLQFREGWAAEIGALLAATAAVLLGRHLALRAGLATAEAEADRGLALVHGHGARLAQASTTVPDPATALRLVQDVDAVRIWRAYRYAPLWLGIATVATALIFALATDVPLGLGLFVVTGLIGVLQVYYGAVSAGVQAAAVEAQVAQREAVHERAVAAPEFARLGLQPTWLDDRSTLRHSTAAAAFRRVGAEVLARGELQTVATAIGAIILLGLGLYRLGFDGLQVGPLLFFGFLVYLAADQLSTAAAAYRARAKTEAARLRLAELAGFVAPRRPAPPAARPPVLHLLWRSPSGEPQGVSFPSAASLGLVGSDAETRRALVAACLGWDNGRGAVLSTSVDPGDAIALQQLGRVAYLSPDAPLVSGTVASNVLLSSRTDLARLREVAAVVGLNEVELPEGFSTRIGFGGSGADASLRTRILLARALYHGADSVVVDGGTDGLTAFEEAYIIDTLAQVPDTQLFLCNARRAQATIGLDYLVQLEEGEVEATGTHEELLRAGGAYALQLSLAKSETT